MVVPTDPITVLRDFRADRSACLGHRRDALFERCDALLSGGPVLSPVHLSLEAVHRRGWGSLYAALARGEIAPPVEIFDPLQAQLQLASLRFDLFSCIGVLCRVQ